jgi:peptidoglycan-associated lipoprotein
MTLKLKNLLLFLPLVLAACGTEPVAEGIVHGESVPACRTSCGGPKAGSLEDFRVNVGDRTFFAYDSVELTADARRTLERQAAWLRQYAAVRVIIEGHADERGTREYNLALGDRRASAQKDYLIALGVAPQRLEAVSYGKERPAALGATEAAWSQNRRSVSVLQIP